jgi:quercetin dioxygenase-like cupin family protein
MPVIKAAESRRTQTANAVMTTLASPTQGSAGQALWRVDMQPGQTGPLHGVDAEQIWTVLAGGATVQLGAESVVVAPGDTLVIPANLSRQISADPHAGFVAIVTGRAGQRACVLADSCAAPAGETVIPAWVI